MRSLSKVTGVSMVTTWGFCMRLLGSLSYCMGSLSEVTVVSKINGVFV